MNVTTDRKFQTQNTTPVLCDLLHGANLIVGNHLTSADVVPKANASTALIGDLANMSHLKIAKYKVDMGSVLTTFSGNRNVIATVSTSVPPDDRPAQIGYYSLLRRLGWRLDMAPLLRDETGRFCELESEVDGAVRRRIRESADNPYVDEIIVFSGDGSNVDAVKYAVRAKKRVVVIAWAGGLNKALAAAASGFAYFDDLATLIGRPYFH